MTTDPSHPGVDMDIAPAAAKQSKLERQLELARILDAAGWIPREDERNLVSPVEERLGARKVGSRIAR